MLSDLTQFLLGSGGKKALPAPSALALAAPATPASGGFPEPEFPPPLPPITTHTTAYCTQDETPVYERPVRALDTVLAYLLYGATVVVERHEGQFSQIVTRDQRGWVHKDVLVYDKAVIFPQLRDGERYDAHHPATVAIRRYLNDPFAAAPLYLPLLPAEQVTYRLREQGRMISWPPRRPRPVGLWHELLRGVPGIQSTIEPRTGALVEWFDDDGEGALRYVEAVHPDRSIVVAGIVDADGRYRVERMSEAEWRSLRPVFITVS